MYGNWIGPVAFCAGALFLYWGGWPLVGQESLLFLVGVVIYAYYFKRLSLPLRDIKAGVWWIAFILFENIISYIGSFNSSVKLIPFPWDNAVIIVFALFFYYWGISSGYRTKELEDYVKGVNADFWDDLGVWARV